MIAEIIKTSLLRFGDMRETQVFSSGSYIALSDDEAADLIHLGQARPVPDNVIMPRLAFKLPPDQPSLPAALALASAGFGTRPAIRGGVAGWHLPSIPGAMCMSAASGFTRDRAAIVRAWRDAGECWPAIVLHFDGFSRIWFWRHGAIKEIPVEVYVR